MSSQKDLPEITLPQAPVRSNPEREHESTEKTVVSTDRNRLSPDDSHSSRSTDESVSAFIEKTATSLALLETETIATFQPTSESVAVARTTDLTFHKVSISEPIAVLQDPLEDRPGTSVRAGPVSGNKAKPLYVDTSDAEDLFDSSGVEAFPAIPAKLTIDPKAFPDFEGDFHSESGQSDAEQAQYRAKLLTEDRQLSGKGKATIKKYFQEVRPIKLPVGHPTIALNADEMHAILRTIADESVLSSYHMMKSLLLHATQGVSRDKRKGLPRRCATPARGFSESSGDETNPSGDTTDGYTSGAINSDEDPYNLGSISGTETANEVDPLFAVGTAEGYSGALDQSGSRTPASGSGYSPTDYQPLSVLRRGGKSADNKMSPPRKRLKLMSKPGKVMKDAYFKGIQWTRTFVTGPLDPVHNKYKFYCMLCKTNVSIYSKGAREILRHYKTEGHLRRDQKWRFIHLQETDSTTGLVTHQVRGKDGYVLTPLELEREKPHFIDAPLVDAGDHFPFYEEYLASLGGITNPDDLRLTTLISLIGSFVPYDGNLTLLQSLWTRVGSFTNHQALFSSFDWSSASLTVSYSPT